jgi:transposase
VTIASESLPDDITALKRIIAEMARDAVAAKAEIAKLKFQLARYRRAEFGRSSEKLTREIEQLELAIESLESDQAERLAAASPMVQRRSRKRSRNRSRRAGHCPSICRAKRCVTRPPAPARTAAAPCGGSAKR